MKKNKKLKGPMASMANMMNEVQMLLTAMNRDPKSCSCTDWAECSICLKHNKCEHEKELAAAAGYSSTKKIWDYIDSLEDVDPNTYE